MKGHFRSKVKKFANYWQHHNSANINSRIFSRCSKNALSSTPLSPLLLWGTTAYSRGSIAMAACWRIDAHDIAVNPSEVQEMFQQNILSGDRKKSTLCRTLGLSYEQLDMLLEVNNLSPVRPPVKMTEDVKSSLDAPLRSGGLNRDVQFSSWIQQVHGIEISR